MLRFGSHRFGSSAQIVQPTSNHLKMIPISFVPRRTNLPLGVMHFLLHTQQNTAQSAAVTMQQEKAFTLGQRFKACQIWITLTCSDVSDKSSDDIRSPTGLQPFLAFKPSVRDTAPEKRLDVTQPQAQFLQGGPQTQETVHR